MGERWRPVRSETPTSASGLCATALRSTGRAFQKEGMKPINATPNELGAASGVAVTLNLGSTGLAFAPTEARAAVRTTQTRILRTDPPMCNLYSITTNQAAIIALFRVINHYVGNLPPMPGVFPDYPAPVVRNASAERELVMMRWGMPPPPRAGGFP